MSDVFARTYGVELLCSQVPSITKPTLLAHMQRRCPGAKPLDPNPQSSLLSFVHPEHPIQLKDARVAAQTFMVVGNQPVNAEQRRAALEQAWDFPAARDAVSRCQATVMVSDLMSSGLEHRERLDLFQRALRAVLDTARCDAIYWRASDRIVDASAWVHAFDAGNAARLFMAGAVNVRMFRVPGPEGSVGEATVMDTLGLGALGLPDLQCHFNGLEPGAVARVLFNTAWYIFSEGDVIADGHTLQGAEPGSTWRCQHEDALVGPERVVLDLDPGAPYAAGNRARG